METHVKNTKPQKDLSVISSYDKTENKQEELVLSDLERERFLLLLDRKPKRTDNLKKAAQKYFNAVS